MMTPPTLICRRDFITRLLVTPPVSRAFRRWSQEPPTTLPTAPYSRGYNFSTLSRWITPTDEFFVRSHFGVPKVAEVADSTTPWTIAVAGSVRRELTITLETLSKLSQREEVVTLECAGNPVGWGGVSNARWTGVPLKALLEAAGVKEDAKEIVLMGADGGPEREAGGILVESYARSIPLAKALDPNTLIVHRMNGESLSPVHGGPVRAIVPGWYGMESVKWLKRILVSTGDYAGFYQAERYYEARRIGGRIERRSLGPVRVKSQIARPIRGQVLRLRDGLVSFVGAAWVGSGEIAAIDVSTDGGRNWTSAKLGLDQAPFAWRLWSHEWTPDGPGVYELSARARDSFGNEQPRERDPAILTPYANNGIDRRTVQVVP